MSTEKTEKIKIARYLAIEKRPYLAAAILTMHIVKNNDCPTLGVSKKWVMYYNEDFIDTLEINQLAGIIIHEVSHLLREHCIRAEEFGIDEKTHDVSNVAMDCEINDDLIEEKILKEDGSFPFCTPVKYGFEDNMTWEYYYKMLFKTGQVQQCPCHGNGSGSDGIAKEWEDAEGNGIDKAEQDLAKKLTAIDIQKHVAQIGTVAGQWQRWADEYLSPPKINWRQQLAMSLKSSTIYVSGNTDYSYSRPSRRRIPKVVLPSMRSPQPKIGVVVDTSGSIDQGMLTVAVNELKAILATMSIPTVRVMSCDCEVQSDQVVSSLTTLELAGGGGTDMGVALHEFDKNRNKRPDIVVVFTDGYTPWPSEKPSFDTIVGLLSNGDEHCGVPEWAKVVKICDE